MSTTYIAESLAAYGLITDWPHHPTTDEGWNAVRPVTVATEDSEARARHELAMHLIQSTGGMEPALQQKFFAASAAIVDGVDAVQISGRVYRIRKIEGS